MSNLQTYVSRLRDEVMTSLNLPDRVIAKDGKSQAAANLCFGARRPGPSWPPALVVWNGSFGGSGLAMGREL